jgi:hypothetical protein
MITSEKLTDARLKCSLCQRWMELKKQGFSGNQAAYYLQRSPSWFSINFPRWERQGITAFLPEIRREMLIRMAAHLGVAAPMPSAASRRIVNYGNPKHDRLDYLTA